MPAYMTSAPETTETARRSELDPDESLGPDEDLVDALDDLTVPELEDLADDNDVDLSDASKKADIVEALANAGVSPPADDD